MVTRSNTAGSDTAREEAVAASVARARSKDAPSPPEEEDMPADLPALCPRRDSSSESENEDVHNVPSPREAPPTNGPGPSILATNFAHPNMYHNVVTPAAAQTQHENIASPPTTETTTTNAPEPTEKEGEEDLSPLPLSEADSAAAAILKAWQAGNSTALSSASKPPSIDSIYAAHMAYAKSNPTAVSTLADGSTACTRGYSNKKKKVINDFLDGLRQYTPKYDRLLVETDQLPPTFVHTPPTVPLLFIALCGEKDKAMKTKLMSDMLVDWVGGMRLKRSKKGSFYHQPATINVHVRTLLAALKEYFEINFTLNDFKFDGGYAGFIRTLFDKRQKEDVSFN